MINGSSAIHNIHTATVTEPHIRATLKYNSFIGKGWDADSDFITSEDAKTVLFNNRYIYYTNAVDSTDQSLVTLDAGGSYLAIHGISNGYINGVSWNDTTRVQRGDFFDSGSTLNFYFLRTGNTGTDSITKVYQMSSANGASWSGATVMNTTVSAAYDYDIAVGLSRSIYTIALDSDHDIIRYGDETSGRSVMYTDMYKTGVWNASHKRLELLEFSDSKWLVMDSGYQNTIQTTESIYNPSYSPFTRLLRIGITSVYETRVIAQVESGEDGLKLVYGGVAPATTPVGSIFAENFNDNSFNTSLWTRTNSTQIVEQNNRIEMSSIAAGNYVTMDSIVYYNLTGGRVSIKIVDVGSLAITSWETYPLTIIKDASNSTQFKIIGGTLTMSKVVAGSGSTIKTLAYDSSLHKYLAIREYGGVLYYEYSIDGRSWKTITSIVAPFAVTALQLEVAVGTWQAEATTTTAVFDDIEINSVRDDSFAYFGINHYNREVKNYASDFGNYEEISTIDTSNTLCKMDSKGRVYQRGFGVNSQTFTSLCVGGISNMYDLTVVSQAGEFSLLFYPFYETYGASTDISSDIVSYANNDNKRISIELGNVK